MTFNHDIQPLCTLPLYLTPLQLLSEEALVSVRDIEDMAALGRQRHACPYYASRASIPLAQIVVLPYNLLLHKSTREAIGIDVKDQV